MTQITEKVLLREIKYKYIVNDRKEFKIQQSRDINQFMLPIYEATGSTEYIEEFYVLCLSRQNHIIGWYRVSSGGVSGTVVDNKVIFSIALQCLASSIILVHNHPSGNRNPSYEDKILTNKISAVAKELGIHLLDHVIMVHNGYFSFADEGVLIKS